MILFINNSMSNSPKEILLQSKDYICHTITIIMSFIFYMIVINSSIDSFAAHCMGAPLLIIVYSHSLRIHLLFFKKYKKLTKENIFMWTHIAGMSILFSFIIMFFGTASTGPHGRVGDAIKEGTPGSVEKEMILAGQQILTRSNRIVHACGLSR